VSASVVEKNGQSGAIQFKYFGFLSAACFITITAGESVYAQVNSGRLHANLQNFDSLVEWRHTGAMHLSEYWQE
jgi:hypothetical protein